ncbi:MAG: DUF1203 domain-containing protein [Hyphomonadaceae bacterium]|nr:DUF1203 domain-containing protein [Hyphomonadaceae bacterium]
MSFRIIGLDHNRFADLHALSDTALAARGAQRVQVAHPHSAPCRISLDDAEPGETVLLLSFAHQPAETPYQQRGPIFVRAGRTRFDASGVVPPALARRTLSLRGYDSADMMVAADLTEGADARRLIERFLGEPDVAYIHAHYARRGCFAAHIARA